MEGKEQTQRSLQRLAAALRQPGPAVPPTFQTYPSISPDEIAQDLDLYVRAAEAGQRGEPSPEMEPPDGIEEAIGVAMEGGAREAALAYRTSLAQQDEVIHRTFLTDEEWLGIEACSRSLHEELRARIHEAQIHLREFWRDRVEAAEVEFQDFRTHNRLENPPRLVSAGEKVLRGFFLAALAACAAVAHGYLMGGGDVDGGWLVQALVGSLLNVGAGVWYARRGFPSLIRRGFGSRVFGLVTAVVFWCGMLGLNLLAAHWRDASRALEGGTIMVALWQHVSQGPFALDSLHSWLLVVEGVASSALAVFVAAGFDEVYPGYGAVGRRRSAALEEFRLETSACSEQMDVLQRSAEADLRATIEAVQWREQQSNAACEARSRIHSDFLDHLDALAAAYAFLCRRYREINAAVQRGNVPRYFALEVQRPDFLADPRLPPLPQPRYQWTEAIELLQQHAASAASLFGEGQRPAKVQQSEPELVEV